MFSRVAVIPFKKITKKQTLKNCLDLQSKLKEVLQSIIKSAGVILELGASFANMREDELFQETSLAVEEDDAGLDMRTQCNYALVLFSPGKVS